MGVGGCAGGARRWSDVSAWLAPRWGSLAGGFTSGVGENRGRARGRGTGGRVKVSARHRIVFTWVGVLIHVGRGARGASRSAWCTGFGYGASYRRGGSRSGAVPASVGRSSRVAGGARRSRRSSVGATRGGFGVAGSALGQLVGVGVRVGVEEGTGGPASVGRHGGASDARALGGVLVG